MPISRASTLLVTQFGGLLEVYPAQVEGPPPEQPAGIVHEIECRAMVSPRKRILADRPRLVRRQGASKLGAVKLRPQCDTVSGERWNACFRNRRAVELLGLEHWQGSGATALRQTLRACQYHHRVAVTVYTLHARWHNKNQPLTCRLSDWHRSVCRSRSQ